MIYLMLAIFSSAMVSGMMRLGEGKIESNAGMFVINYLVCTLLSRWFMGDIRLFVSSFSVRSRDVDRGKTEEQSSYSWKEYDPVRLSGRYSELFFCAFPVVGTGYDPGGNCLSGV